MNLKEIKELIELMTEKDICELELERAGVRLRISRARKAAVETGVPAALPPPAVPAVAANPVAANPAAAAPAPAPAAPPAAPPLEPREDLHIVKSPIVGTFYEGPAPGAPPFVKLGDPVQPGKVLCIIEAMKLMNEIESDVAGEILKRFVENAQPVEYGEALFAIRPLKE
jgi:acetyl-CoA carboxylase biotin carboxyl carrier protein